MFADFRHFFRLSRPVNVLISAVAFAIACFLAMGKSADFLLDAEFWATAFVITGIAATGYWINDVFDFRIDRINKPRKTIVNAHLSVKKVLTVYFAANFILMAFSLIFFGFYLNRINVTFINALSVLMLFVYASWLKRVSVAGNLVISFLTALVLFLAYYVYDRVSLALIWAIVFAFEITLIREITKDVEDIRGDLAYQLRTLPIQIGIRSTRHVLYGLYAIFLLTCWMPVLMMLAVKGLWLWQYALASVLLVQAPAAWIIGKLRAAAEPEQYSRQSRALKYLMLSGMITLFFL
ncbi:MAG: geranylgeranylglycerol-phosphate geranylgeranyltransferase [Bacteroidia bacterium]|nr:geranylgeranylglycerol-phosphate geranylgeranyltransferase [Bacteroidia bacterium]